MRRAGACKGQSQTNAKFDKFSEILCYVIALLLAKNIIAHRVLDRKYNLMEQFEVSKILFIKASKDEFQLIVVAEVHEPFSSHSWS